MAEVASLSENERSIYYRFYVYQKERFPFIAHGLLIGAFSFSAVSYSRICRGASGFIPWPHFLAGIFITVTLFFLVRVFDEFKDKEDDARYRSYLPVPRGLISFRELRIAGIIAAVMQLGIIMALFPKMLALYLLVIGYLLLMGKEFFVPEWLRRHQVAYVASHMLIIPLIDTYASGLDWLLSSVSAPAGLLFFFAVSYMNGIVLEIGRKIRPPEKEEEGVLTYSALYGPDRAALYWILTMLSTLALSIAASIYAGYGLTAYITLTSIFLICSLPALLFFRHKTARLGKTIEYASALWTIGMYLTLGGAPMLHNLIFR